jgi:UDP-glucuronate 4-epimerase
MALFIFTKAILEGSPISVFNHGYMKRDFTYIDDIVEGTARVIDSPPEADAAWDRLNPDPGTSYAPYRIYNIGNDRSIRLMDFIEAIEECLGKKARKNLMEMQPGDVPASRADIDNLARDFGFRPSTPLKEGIARFIAWYREYYKV